MTTANLTDIFGPMFEGLSKDGATALEALGTPPNASVLDVGTGRGAFAVFLASQGLEVTTGEPATDTSQYAGKDWADSAEKAGVADKIRFKAFNAGAMPFEDSSFDAVFFFGVLHHIDEAIRAAVMREALRVARPEGGVVFFEPRKETLEKLWVDDPGHPQAAVPTNYLDGLSTKEQKLEGVMMDIYVYQRTD